MKSIPEILIEFRKNEMVGAVKFLNRVYLKELSPQVCFKTETHQFKIRSDAQSVLSEQTIDFKINEFDFKLHLSYSIHRDSEAFADSDVSGLEFGGFLIIHNSNKNIICFEKTLKSECYCYGAESTPDNIEGWKVLLLKSLTQDLKTRAKELSKMINEFLEGLTP